MQARGGKWGKREAEAFILPHRSTEESKVICLGECIQTQGLCQGLLADS